MLNKKIKEFERDEEGDIEIPLEKDVVDAIINMVRQFDASEFGNAFSKVDVEFLTVSKGGWAEVYVYINGCQYTYHRIFDGDSWNPSENNINESIISEWLDIETEGITDDMTVADIIGHLGDAVYDDKELSKKLYEMTKDINGDE